MRPSVISDLRWWLELLSHPRPPISIAAPPSTTDLHIWVDASSEFGIGLLFEGFWTHWCGPSRDIGWLEALAIDDNEGAIAAYQKGRCRNFMTNLCIRRTALLLHEAAVSLEFVYVPSADNLADPFHAVSSPQPSHSPLICRSIFPWLI